MDILSFYKAPITVYNFYVLSFNASSASKNFEFIVKSIIILSGYKETEASPVTDNVLASSHAIELMLIKNNKAINEINFNLFAILKIFF